MTIEDTTRWLDQVEPTIDAAAEQTAGMTAYEPHDGQEQSDLSYLYADLMAEPDPAYVTPSVAAQPEEQ